MRRHFRLLSARTHEASEKELWSSIPNLSCSWHVKIGGRIKQFGWLVVEWKRRNQAHTVLFARVCQRSFFCMWCHMWHHTYVMWHHMWPILMQCMEKIYSQHMYLWILSTKFVPIHRKRIASCLWFSNERVVLPLNATKRFHHVWTQVMQQNIVQFPCTPFYFIFLCWNM